MTDGLFNVSIGSNAVPAGAGPGSLARPVCKRSPTLYSLEFVVGTLHTWHCPDGEFVSPMMPADYVIYAPAYFEEDETAGG